MKKLQIATGIGLITILCVGYFLFRTDAAAQTVADTDAAMLKNRIQVFFDTISEQPNSLSAYQKMFYGSPLTDSSAAEMSQKTDDLTKSGTGWTPELLDTKSIGTDLILIRYLYKSETHPVIWYFTFYRPPAATRTADNTSRTWICIGIKFDTNYELFFNESWPK